MSTATRPLTDGLFTERPDGTIVLIGGYSPSSGRTHFPLLPACPYSGAADIETVELPQQGTLWLWTSVSARPPGYDGNLPFGFGVVELTGGLRVITRLVETDPHALEFGQPMHLVPEVLQSDDDGTEVITYAFAADGARDGSEA